MIRLTAALLALGLALPAHAAVYRAIDGDTVAFGRDRLRLVGFDAPETTYQARCPEEKAHGVVAKARLQELLTRGPVRVVKVKGRDKYRRILALIYVGGESVGDVLIREGLAVPYTKRVSRIRNFNWCENLRPVPPARGDGSPVEYRIISR